MNNESEELALTFIEIHITQQRERVPKKKQKNKKMRQLSRDLETDSAFSQVPIYCSAREDLSPSCVLVRDSVCFRPSIPYPCILLTSTHSTRFRLQPLDLSLQTTDRLHRHRALGTQIRLATQYQYQFQYQRMHLGVFQCSVLVTLQPLCPSVLGTGSHGS